MRAHQLPEAVDEQHSKFIVSPEHAPNAGAFKEGRIDIRITDYPEVDTGTILDPEAATPTAVHTLTHNSQTTAIDLDRVDIQSC